MRIKIETLDGKRIGIDVESDDSIKELKNRIADSLGINQENFSITLDFNYRFLEDTFTLRDYNIRKDSVIKIKGIEKIKVKDLNEIPQIIYTNIYPAIYIASININFPDNYSIDNKTKKIMEQMKVINDDKIKLMGIESIAIIILPEYMLTPNPVPHHEKMLYLEKFNETIQNFPNTIFIPGTILSYRKISESLNPEKKKSKIIDNYEHNLRIDSYKQMNFEYYKANYTKAIEGISDKNSIFLEDCAYIFSKELVNKPIKSKKSYPVSRDIELTSKQTGFFYPGKAPEIKNIPVANKTMDIHTVICADHNLSLSKEIIITPPLIEIIISDGIPHHSENFSGVINIHVDNAVFLSGVFINDSHPRRNEIDPKMIKGFAYNDFKKSEIKIENMNIDLNSDIKKPPPT